jgi:arylsulfatase
MFQLVPVTVVLAAVSVPPNFLVILADDMGYGDLGSYGHPVSRTPQIDALASEGLRFTSFYAASPVCSPSRSALVTGRLMPRTGIYCDNNTEACQHPEQSTPKCCPGVFLPGMPGGLPLSEITVASALRKQFGYKTMLVGKWSVPLVLTELSTRPRQLSIMSS